MEELGRASQQLRVALDNYLANCTFIRDSCIGGGSSTNSAEFYSRLESEWNQFLGHKTKLVEAQAAINAARNTRPVTSINSLPPEVLTWIFSLVIDDWDCIFHPQYQSSPYIAVGKDHILYSDALSHVCSSWRSLITGSPRFWSHIDLVLDHPLNPGLFARAKAFAVLAGEHPLHIHICDPGYSEPMGNEMGLFLILHTGNPPRNSRASQRTSSAMHHFRFLTSLPANIDTLSVDFVAPSRTHHSQTAALDYFLGNCNPETFSCFSTRSRDTSFGFSRGVDTRFIEPADNPLTQTSMLLAIPGRQLEHIWLGTTILRINGVCPTWRSQAYHGLVELRLDEWSPRIHEAQLVNILKLSPKLRVFHLRTDLATSTRFDVPLEPILLEDLEELDIKARAESEPDFYGGFLRWITPGPKPLQFSFYGTPDEGPVPFCARANVTRFYVEDPEEGIDEMIRHMPCSQLEVFGVNGNRVERVGIDMLLSGRQGSGTRVDTLYLVNFNGLPLGDIQDMIVQYSVKHLIVRRISIAYETVQGEAIASDLQEVKTLLHILQPLPDIQCLTDHCPLDPEYWRRW